MSTEETTIIWLVIVQAFFCAWLFWDIFTAEGEERRARPRHALSRRIYLAFDGREPWLKIGQLVEHNGLDYRVEHADDLGARLGRLEGEAWDD